MESRPKSCIICQADICDSSDISEVGAKGLASLITFSSLHGHTQFNNNLTELQRDATPISIHVHKSCRRNYTNRKRLKPKEEGGDQNPIQRRSQAAEFNWKQCCLFCGKEAKFDQKHPDRNIFHQCETLTMKKRILQLCEERGDSWADEVQRRVLDCFDLVASEARYHRNCQRSFF